MPVTPDDLETGMPGYYFHTDQDGIEPTDLAAKAAALKCMREMTWNLPDFWKGERFRITVSDEKGLSLFTLDLIATMAAASPSRR